MIRKRTIRIAIFLIILVIVICVALRMASLQERYQNEPYGTFATGSVHDSTYLVIEKNGSFMQYVQGEILEKGSVEIDDQVIRILLNDELWCAVYDDYQIFLFDAEQSEITIYRKISDTPTYINVDS